MESPWGEMNFITLLISEAPLERVLTSSLEGYQRSSLSLPSQGQTDNADTDNNNDQTITGGHQAIIHPTNQRAMVMYHIVPGHKIYSGIQPPLLWHIQMVPSTDWISLQRCLDQMTFNLFFWVVALACFWCAQKWFVRGDFLGTLECPDLSSVP